MNDEQLIWEAYSNGMPSLEWLAKKELKNPPDPADYYTDTMKDTNKQIWEAYKMIKESSDAHKKTFLTSYEWVVEVIDIEYEDVLETTGYLSMLAVCEHIKDLTLPPDQKYMIGLRRKREIYVGGDFADDAEDHDVAYIEDGRLPDRFPYIGAIVPKKYKLEFDKHKACLPPDLE
jgi:hypothetical protein